MGEATHQNQRKIDIVYITIVFVSVLVGFVIAAILAHVTWALSIRTVKIVTWVLTQEWTLGWDTMVYTCIYLVAIKITALLKLSAGKPEQSAYLQISLTFHSKNNRLAT